MNNVIFDIIELSKKLIFIKSDPENKLELNKALDLIKSEFKGFTIEDFEKNNKKSILVSNSKKGQRNFRVILNGHLDVIPGKDFQYNPIIKDGKLFGVGSMDMKSNVACLVKVFKEVSKKVEYPIALQIVTDEEIGGFDGTKYQIDEGVRSDFVISGETTNFNIVNRARGIIWLKIHSKGLTAHGAYPWRGENSIWILNEFLNKLKNEFPNPKEEDWKTSVNLAKIEVGNNTFNKIPDESVCWLDIRFIPEDRDLVIPKIQSLMTNNMEMEIVANEPALFVDESNYYLQHLKTVCKNIRGEESIFYGAKGSSDARHFTRVNNDGIEFGPIGGGIGTDEEWVDISSLEVYYNILKEFLVSLN